MIELVSIIVPVYNVQDYVDACLQSLIKQTYKNIEIIVVNDGSTDKSFQVCKKISLGDSRIRLFSKKNGGLSDARNYGIRMARGDYICFVDSDDVVSEEYVNILYKAMKCKGTDISICRFDFFDDACLFKQKKESTSTRSTFSSQWIFC